MRTSNSTVVPATPQRSAWLRTAVPSTTWPRLNADQRTQVLIIGAGYTGLNAAIRLCELSRECVVLEAQEPGFGASGRNGGQVVPGLKHDPTELVSMLGEERGLALARFAGEAASRTFELIRRHQMQCDAEARGWLQPAVDGKTLRAVTRRAKSWADLDGVGVRVLDAPEVRQMTGTDAYAGGWIDPRGGQLQPLSYARELARVASSTGARIYTGSAVTSLVRSGPKWIVEANGCRASADAVLICTNGYTGGARARARSGADPGLQHHVRDQAAESGTAKADHAGRPAHVRCAQAAHLYALRQRRPLYDRSARLIRAP
jgi:glycine/D-amino acid oxidase-like deaminating enzyme